jgi:carboxyl-terminal processing protease
MRKASLLMFGAVIGVVLATVASNPGLILSADAKAVVSIKDYRALALFGTALEWVRRGYVEKPNDGKLIKSAVNGMLAGLEDSYYLDPKSWSRGAACGTPDCTLASGTAGFAFTIDDGLIRVITPIDDTAAATANMMAGDIIVGIDDEVAQGLTYYQAAEKFHGNVGTTIRLKIARPGADKPIDISITRSKPDANSVRSRIENGDTAYIRIGQFHEDTADRLKKAIDDIAAQTPPEKLKGYVLDLRNNPGGVQDAAIAVADEFLEQGEIVSIRGRKPEATRSFRAKPGDIAKGKPVIVLINAGSAGGAEVVAGALQDDHRATLVGSRTFGEGAVATSFPLGPLNGGIRLTVGHYFTPSGHLIEGKGISPDVEVLQDVPDALEAAAKSNGDKTGVKKVALQSYIPPDATADKALNRAYDLVRDVKAATP